MKLVYCEKCQDVVRLTLEEMRYCKCGAVGGKYVGKSLAVVFGGPVVLGLTWDSLVSAINYWEDSGGGRMYDPRLDINSFVIPTMSPKVLRFATEGHLKAFMKRMAKADEEVMSHD